MGLIEDVVTGRLFRVVAGWIPDHDPVVVVRTLVRSGLLEPGMPHRQLGQLLALVRWGTGLAGEALQAAARSPGRVAIVDEERGPVSYAELVAGAERAAAVLRERGATAGSRVGLMARDHVGAVEVMLAASLGGADLVLVNTGLSGARLASVIAAQRLDILVHDDEFATSLGRMPRGTQAISESALAAAVDAIDDPEPTPVPPEPGRTIILTSGTTGLPKGAARRTPGGIGPLVSIIERIPLRTGDVVHVAAPIFHTWGFAALQICLALRATVVLRRRFDAADALATLGRERCDALIAVPVMLQRILEQVTGGSASRPADRTPAAGLERLRVVAASGSAFPAGFATRFMDVFGDVLYNLYGSTEASWVCIATPADLRRHPDCVGTPPVGTVVRILDAEDHDVPEGVTGRILCGNELLFEGYTSSSQGGARGVPGGGDGGSATGTVGGLVATGDLGHVSDGLWFVDGRADDMVISGGENIYPAEVEGVLTRHPAVREAAVVGVPDAEFGQRLAAYLVLQPGASLDADEVREHVRAHGARHLVPRDVYVIDALPRNATGKVLTRELRGVD